MKRSEMFLVLLFSLLISGCATSKHVPDFAFYQPEQQISVSHPDQLEKETDSVVVFSVIIHPYFLVEADGISGVWPALALLPDGRLKEGFVYSQKKASLENPWGLVIGEAVFSGKLADLAGSRIVFVNQDGGAWMASPVAEKILSEDKEEYDSQSLEKNPEYRQEVFREVGLRLEEVNAFWKNFLQSKGVEVERDFQTASEIRIGSKEWDDFRQRFLAEFSNGYEMPDGTIRAGRQEIKDFKKVYASNPRMTPWQRFLDRLSIPLAPTPELIALGVGSSIVNGGIASVLGSHWGGRTARAECQRRDLAEQIKKIAEFYSAKRR